MSAGMRRRLIQHVRYNSPRYVYTLKGLLCLIMK